MAEFGWMPRCDLAALDLLVGGGALIFVALLLLPSILILIAIWRMGSGLKMIGEAMRRPDGTPTLAVSLAGIEAGIDRADAEAQAAALGRLADAQNSEGAKQLVAAARMQAEATTALAKQMELAVQWYVHSLQASERSPAKK